jgi:EmrB/QacA subfamily drug resistance transporter
MSAIRTAPARAGTRARAVHPHLLLLIFCAASFMTALDVFIVNVGLRDIGADVGGRSLGDLSWVLNAYAIVFAALLVPAGRLADRYGNKRAFLAGLLVFTLASLGCAVAGDLWVLVALRALQAIGAAALVPTSLGLILTTIPGERRDSAIRIWAVSGSIGAAAGPALGGLLVSLSWRWIFVLNVPIGVAAFVAAIAFVPDVRTTIETRVPDLLGGLLLILGTGSLALGLVEGPDWGWGSASTLGTFAVTVVGIALFVVRSARHLVPVVDLALLRDPVFAWANISTFFVNLAFGIQLLGLVLWMQEGWGWSALHTGLLIAPGPVMVSVAAIGLRRFTARMADGVVAAVGTLLIGGGGVLIGTSIGASPDYVADILPGWLIIGAGVGFAMPTIVAAGTVGLAPHQTSTGSAILQMARWIGSAIGVAVLVIVLGDSVVTAATVDRFTDAWWWAGGFAVVGAAAALAVRPRREVAPAAAPAPVTGAE